MNFHDKTKIKQKIFYKKYKLKNINFNIYKNTQIIVNKVIKLIVINNIAIF